MLASEDEDPSIRVLAIKILAKYHLTNQSVVLRMLVECLKDSNEFVRKNVVHVLGSQNLLSHVDAITALIETLQDPNE